MGNSMTTLLGQPCLIDEPLNPNLSEIRLISITSGPSLDGLIRCSLRKCSLDDNPRYCALSYVWGDPNITRQIEVNGERFEATTNLVDALLQVSKDEDAWWDHI